MDEVTLGRAQAHRQEAFVAGDALKESFDAWAGGTLGEANDRVLYRIEDQLRTHLHVGAEPPLDEFAQEGRGGPGNASQDEEQRDEESQCHTHDLTSCGSGVGNAPPTQGRRRWGPDHQA